MKKLTILLLGVFILSGCVQTNDLPQIVESTLKQQSLKQMPVGYNKTKKYYSYYLPKDMGRQMSTQLGEIFLKDNTQILMNFDPSAIIIKEYYKTDDKDESMQVDENLSEEEVQAALETSQQEKLQEVTLDEENSNEEKQIYRGFFRNSAGEVQPYEFQIIKNGSDYLLYYDFAIAKFYVVTPVAGIKSITDAIMTIARSIQYDESFVLSNFSMKKTVESKKQTIESFQQNLSKDGSFVDLIEDNEEEILPEGRH